MHDHSSKPAATAASDHLTDMLRGLRLDGVEYGRCEMTAPWAIAVPAAEGRALLLHREARLLAADAVEGMARTARWRCGAAAARRRACARQRARCRGLSAGELPDPKVCGNIFDVKGGGDGQGAGEATLLFSGSMTFNVDSAHPLLRMMPDLMRMFELATSEPGIPHLLEAMAREVAMDRVGAGGILARLADVLAASIIRSWVESGCGDATGWIAAARCPEIGKVLAAIHVDPERDWTVATLARMMGASRSGFAERFASVVGETPARYVAQVRMQQARQWLAATSSRSRSWRGVWAMNRKPPSAAPSSASSARRRTWCRTCGRRHRRGPGMM
jgi:AraC-like DNA-binding protein